MSFCTSEFCAELSLGVASPQILWKPHCNSHIVHINPLLFFREFCLQNQYAYVKWHEIGNYWWRLQPSTYIEFYLKELHLKKLFFKVSRWFYPSIIFALIWNHLDKRLYFSCQNLILKFDQCTSLVKVAFICLKNLLKVRFQNYILIQSTLMIFLLTRMTSNWFKRICSMIACWP